MLHNHKHVEYKHRNTNTYRLETRPEERNQDLKRYKENKTKEEKLQNQGG